MKKLLAILWLTVSFAYAQDQSTPNLITNQWSGIQTVGSVPQGCATAGPCPGGPGALYDPNTNTIHFSYGQATVAQTFAINQALANVGAGIQIKGYNYSWDINNLNGDNRQGSTDTLTATVQTWNYNNTTVRRTDTWLYNTKFDWTTFSGSIDYANPGPVSDFGNLSVSFSGKDSGYWGGYFGPQVRNVNINMRYGVDACASDPLSNVNCSGYAQAWLNLQCSGNALYSPQCPGYAQAYFTQQCTVNALSDPSCPGYAAAYLTYQCSVNPLYSTTCPGYETAYLNQQCSISPLYSQSCSGYSTAYHDSQCRTNPLYDVNCTGYQSAYLTQQCTSNPLYSTTCPGYLAAYKSQQCSINSLYATDCPGYAQAYFTQQCSLNGLYDQRCSNYSTAYAKKMLLEQQGLASTVATAGTVVKTAELASNSTTVSIVSDPVVNQTLTSTTTSTSPANSATAAVPLVSAPQGVSNVTTASVSTVAPPPTAETKNKGPQTARESIQARQRESAQKEAVAKGKNLANEMGKTADMESQKQIQNVVIAAMGFTPGFDVYKNATVPDSIGYQPYSVYTKQINVDNVKITRRMFGPSDRLHEMMVEMQWEIK